MTIQEIKAFEDFVRAAPSLENTTIVGVDFSGMDIAWQSLHIDNTWFLGCRFNPEDQVELVRIGANLLFAPNALPYHPFRTTLYTWQELLEATGPEVTRDLAIYTHFRETRHNPSINEALWQRMHDHAIDEAMRDLLRPDRRNAYERRCVGMMGGHSTLRDSENYRKAALTAYHLSQHGYFIVSGGGPGIMEAANLGAWISSYGIKALFDAIAILSRAPAYRDAGYLDTALEVLEKYPHGHDSLAIPTWFYGHEPSNVFATSIAKYFSNSIREDTLLAISLHGVVFAPGSAGTTQEIFMDAAQNHYGTFDYYSPMVFLGKKRYTYDTLLFPLLKQLSWDKTYHKLLYLSDDPLDIAHWIKSHPPVRKR